MQQSLLRYSAWISLVFLATACFSPRITITGENSAAYDKTMQPGIPDKVIYKTTVMAGGQEMTGRLMLKKVDDDTYRVAWYNEIGMTYLEAELVNSSRKEKLIVHNIIPALDNNLFLSKFGKSVRQLID